MSVTVGELNLDLRLNFAKLQSDLKLINQKTKTLVSASISPTVDLSQLHELNSLLDIKKKHLDDTTDYFAKRPIKPQIDTGGMALEIEKTIPSEIPVTIKITNLEQIKLELENLSTIQVKNEIKSTSEIIKESSTKPVKKNNTSFKKDLNEFGLFADSVNSFAVSVQKFAKANQTQKTSFTKQLMGVFKGYTSRLLFAGIEHVFVNEVAPRIIDSATKKDGLVNKGAHYAFDKMTIPGVQIAGGTFKNKRIQDSPIGSLIGLSTIMERTTLATKAVAIGLDKIEKKLGIDIPFLESIDKGINYVGKQLVNSRGKQARNLGIGMIGGALWKYITHVRNLEFDTRKNTVFRDQAINSDVPFAQALGVALGKLSPKENKEKAIQQGFVIGSLIKAFKEMLGMGNTEALRKIQDQSKVENAVIDSGVADGNETGVNAQIKRLFLKMNIWFSTMGQIFVSKAQSMPGGFKELFNKSKSIIAQALKGNIDGAFESIAKEIGGFEDFKSKLNDKKSLTTEEGIEKLNEQISELLNEIKSGISVSLKDNIDIEVATTADNKQTSDNKTTNKLLQNVIKTLKEQPFQDILSKLDQINNSLNGFTNPSFNNNSSNDPLIQNLESLFNNDTENKNTPEIDYDTILNQISNYLDNFRLVDYKKQPGSLTDMVSELSFLKEGNDAVQLGAKIPPKSEMVTQLARKIQSIKGLSQDKKKDYTEHLFNYIRTNWGKLALQTHRSYPPDFTSNSGITNRLNGEQITSTPNIPEIDDLGDTELIQAKWKQTTKVIASLLSKLTTDVQEVSDVLQHLLAEGSPGLTQTIREMWGKTVKFVATSVQSLPAVFQKIGQSIKSAFSFDVDNFTQGVTTKAKDTLNNGKNLFNSVKNQATSLLNEKSQNTQENNDIPSFNPIKSLEGFTPNLDLLEIGKKINTFLQAIKEKIIKIFDISIFLSQIQPFLSKVQKTIIIKTTALLFAIKNIFQSNFNKLISFYQNIDFNIDIPSIPSVNLNSLTDKIILNFEDIKNKISNKLNFSESLARVKTKLDKLQKTVETRLSALAYTVKENFGQNLLYLIEKTKAIKIEIPDLHLASFSRLFDFRDIIENYTEQQKNKIDEVIKVSLDASFLALQDGLAQALLVIGDSAPMIAESLGTGIKNTILFFDGVTQKAFDKTSGEVILDVIGELIKTIAKGFYNTTTFILKKLFNAIGRSLANTSKLILENINKQIHSIIPNFLNIKNTTQDTFDDINNEISGILDTLELSDDNKSIDLNQKESLKVDQASLSELTKQINLLSKNFANLNQKGKRALFQKMGINNDGYNLPVGALIQKIKAEPSTIDNLKSFIDTKWQSHEIELGISLPSDINNQIDNISSLFESTSLSVIGNLESMSDYAIACGDDILHAIAEGSPGTTASIRKAYDKTTSHVLSKFTILSSESQKTGSIILNSLNHNTDKIQKAHSKMSQHFKNIAGEMSNNAQQSGQKIKSYYTSAAGEVGDAAQKAGQKMVSETGKAIQQTSQLLNDLKEKPKQTITNAGKQAGSIISSTAKNIDNAAGLAGQEQISTQPFEEVGIVLEGIFATIKEGAIATGEEVSFIFKDILGQVPNTMEDVNQTFKKYKETLSGTAEVHLKIEKRLTEANQKEKGKNKEIRESLKGLKNLLTYQEKLNILIDNQPNFVNENNDFDNRAAFSYLQEMEIALRNYHEQLQSLQGTDFLAIKPLTNLMNPDQLQDFMLMMDQLQGHAGTVGTAFDFLTKKVKNYQSLLNNLSNLKKDDVERIFGSGIANITEGLKQKGSRHRRQRETDDYRKLADLDRTYTNEDNKKPNFLTSILSGGIKAGFNTVMGMYQGIKSMIPIVGQLETVFIGLISGITLKGVFDILTVAMNKFNEESLDAAIKIENLQYQLNSLKPGQAESTLKRIRDITNEFGVSFEAASQGYVSFISSTMGTGLSTVAEDIFKATSKILSSRNVAPQQQEAVFRALTQMASKGKVSLEELNGQLGEALPGALSMAAKGLGVTNEQLIAMVENGQVLSEDLLPKLAQEFMSQTEGVTFDDYYSELNRFQNNLNLFYSTLGKGSVELNKTGLSLFNKSFALIANNIETIVAGLKLIGLTFLSKLIPLGLNFAKIFTAFNKPSHYFTKVLPSRLQVIKNAFVDPDFERSRLPQKDITSTVSNAQLISSQSNKGFSKIGNFLNQEITWKGIGDKINNTLTLIGNGFTSLIEKAKLAGISITKSIQSTTASLVNVGKMLTNASWGTVGMYLKATLLDAFDAIKMGIMGTIRVAGTLAGTLIKTFAPYAAMMYGIELFTALLSGGNSELKELQKRVEEIKNRQGGESKNTNLFNENGQLNYEELANQTDIEYKSFAKNKATNRNPLLNLIPGKGALDTINFLGSIIDSVNIDKNKKIFDKSIQGSKTTNNKVLTGNYSAITSDLQNIQKDINITKAELIIAKSEQNFKKVEALKDRLKDLNKAFTDKKKEAPDLIELEARLTQLNTQKEKLQANPLIFGITNITEYNQKLQKLNKGIETTKESIDKVTEALNPVTLYLSKMAMESFEIENAFSSAMKEIDKLSVLKDIDINTQKMSALRLKSVKSMAKIELDSAKESLTLAEKKADILSKTENDLNQQYQQTLSQHGIREQLNTLLSGTGKTANDVMGINVEELKKTYKEINDKTPEVEAALDLLARLQQATTESRQSAADISNQQLQVLQSEIALRTYNLSLMQSEINRQKENQTQLNELKLTLEKIKAVKTGGDFLPLEMKGLERNISILEKSINTRLAFASDLLTGKQKGNQLVNNKNIGQVGIDIVQAIKSSTTSIVDAITNKNNPKVTAQNGLIQNENPNKLLSVFPETKIPVKTFALKNNQEKPEKKNNIENKKFSKDIYFTPPKSKHPYEHLIYKQPEKKNSTRTNQQTNLDWSNIASLLLQAKIKTPVTIQDKSAIKEKGGSYHPGTNILSLNKETLNRLSSNDVSKLTPQDVEILIHELRHFEKDNNPNLKLLSNLNVLDKETQKRVNQGVQGSLAIWAAEFEKINKRKPNQKEIEKTKAEELDAYIFAALKTQQFFGKKQTPSKENKQPNLTPPKQLPIVNKETGTIVAKQIEQALGKQTLDKVLNQGVGVLKAGDLQKLSLLDNLAPETKAFVEELQQANQQINEKENARLELIQKELELTKRKYAIELAIIKAIKSNFDYLSNNRINLSQIDLNRLFLKGGMTEKEMSFKQTNLEIKNLEAKFKSLQKVLSSSNTALGKFSGPTLKQLEVAIGKPLTQMTNYQKSLADNTIGTGDIEVARQKLEPLLANNPELQSAIDTLDLVLSNKADLLSSYKEWTDREVQRLKDVANNSLFDDLLSWQKSFNQLLRDLRVSVIQMKYTIDNLKLDSETTKSKINLMNNVVPGSSNTARDFLTRLNAREQEKIKFKQDENNILSEEETLFADEKKLAVAEQWISLAKILNNQLRPTNNMGLYANDEALRNAITIELTQKAQKEGRQLKPEEVESVWNENIKRRNIFKSELAAAQASKDPTLLRQLMSGDWQKNFSLESLTELPFIDIKELEEANRLAEENNRQLRENIKIKKENLALAKQASQLEYIDDLARMNEEYVKSNIEFQRAIEDSKTQLIELQNQGTNLNIDTSAYENLVKTVKESSDSILSQQRGIDDTIRDKKNRVLNISTTIKKLQDQITKTTNPAEIKQLQLAIQNLNNELAGLSNYLGSNLQGNTNGVAFEIKKMLTTLANIKPLQTAIKGIRELNNSLSDLLKNNLDMFFSKWSEFSSNDIVKEFISIQQQQLEFNLKTNSSEFSQKILQDVQNSVANAQQTLNSSNLNVQAALDSDGGAERKRLEQLVSIYGDTPDKQKAYADQLIFAIRGLTTATIELKIANNKLALNYQQNTGFGLLEGVKSAQSLMASSSRLNRPEQEVLNQRIKQLEIEEEYYNNQVKAKQQILALEELFNNGLAKNQDGSLMNLKDLEKTKQQLADFPKIIKNIKLDELAIESRWVVKEIQNTFESGFSNFFVDIFKFGDTTAELKRELKDAEESTNRNIDKINKLRKQLDNAFLTHLVSILKKIGASILDNIGAMASKELSKSLFNGLFNFLGLTPKESKENQEGKELVNDVALKMMTGLEKSSEFVIAQTTELALSLKSLNLVVQSMTNSLSGFNTLFTQMKNLPNNETNPNINNTNTNNNTTDTTNVPISNNNLKTTSTNNAIDSNISSSNFVNANKLGNSLVRGFNSFTGLPTHYPINIGKNPLKRNIEIPLTQQYPAPPETLTLFDQKQLISFNPAPDYNNRLSALGNAAKNGQTLPVDLDAVQLAKYFYTGLENFSTEDIEIALKANQDVLLQLAKIAESTFMQLSSADYKNPITRSQGYFNQSSLNKDGSIVQIGDVDYNNGVITPPNQKNYIETQESLYLDSFNKLIDPTANTQSNTKNIEHFSQQTQSNTKWMVSGIQNLIGILSSSSVGNIGGGIGSMLLGFLGSGISSLFSGGAKTNISPLKSLPAIVANAFNGGTVGIANLASGGPVNGMNLNKALDKAIKREKAAGGDPRLIVASKGEEVLEKKSDAPFFRMLKESGQWNKLKQGEIPSYNSGGTIGNGFISSQRNITNKANHNSVNINVYAKDVNSFNKSQSQIQRDMQRQLNRSNQRNG